MSQTNWEADKMLDVYIHDYLTKRKLHATAKAFQAEGKVSSDPVAIDAPGGFLFEWWSVFWDIFIARTNEKHSDVAASYIETQHIKAREQQQQQQQPLQSQHQHHQQQQHQQQLQQMLMQRQQQQQQQQQPQQQRRDGPHLLNGSANGLISSDSLSRQSPGTANVMATKMYEERLKLPLRESMEDAATKRFNDNAAPLLDTNHPSMLKSAATSGQTPGQVMHGTSGALPCSLPQVQPRGQQIPGSVQDIKTEVNPVMNSRAAGPDSLVGVPGSNQGANNLTLRGWPLTGIDQLRSGILQQKPFLQSPQPFHQLQVLTPQQQLLLQAQQSSSAGDAEARKLRMLLSNRNMILGKDNQQNPVGDVIPNVGSPMQSASPVMPRGETDMLIKQKIAQLHQQQQQQQGGIQQQTLQQHGILNQSQSSNQSILQQDKMATGSVTMIGSGSSSFRGNDQTSKSQNGRKRKQPVSSSDPANSSGTANTAGPSPSSAPSTPSTHTPGDVISMPPIPHSGTSSKPLMMFSSDGPGTLPSPSNQLWDDKGELLVEDASLEDNVESFLSHDENDARDAVGRSDTSKGFSFNEVVGVPASVSKVVCCHFSSDGKLLATGGHDKKAVLWSTENLKPKTTLEEHTSYITDIRFSPSMSRLATSSFDKTVRVWDADNPSYSLRTFTGHSASVMSLDFHPNREDLICSCDGMGQIRYWSINNGSCNGIFEGATTQIRFQPRVGKYLAAASDKLVTIIDVETRTARQTLQTHTSTVHSVCWNATGDCLASVSEDSVKVWSIGSGGEGECIHELSNGNKFNSCVFHPSYPSLLVIGCYQSLELWNMVENKTMTLSAHEGLIASLAVSNVTGYVASVSHDTYVKLWK